MILATCDKLSCISYGSNAIGNRWNTRKLMPIQSQHVNATIPSPSFHDIILIEYFEKYNAKDARNDVSFKDTRAARNGSTLRSIPIYAALV